MIYQSQKKFQAQLNYRGKIYTVSNGESIPSLGKVVHIDDKQVVMKEKIRFSHTLLQVLIGKML